MKFFEWQLRELLSEYLNIHMRTLNNLEQVDGKTQSRSSCTIPIEYILQKIESFSNNKIFSAVYFYLKIVPDSCINYTFISYGKLLVQTMESIHRNIRESQIVNSKEFSIAHTSLSGIKVPFLCGEKLETSDMHTTDLFIIYL